MLFSYIEEHCNPHVHKIVHFQYSLCTHPRVDFIKVESLEKGGVDAKTTMSYFLGPTSIGIIKELSDL